MNKGACTEKSTKDIAVWFFMAYFTGEGENIAWNAILKTGVTMENIPKKVTFEYKISPNFIVYAATGAIGGLNAQGQIIINFFNERAAIPKTQTYDVNEKGALIAPPIAEEKKGSIIRDVYLAISLSPQTARGLAEFLSDQADSFDKIRSSLAEGVPK